MADRFRELERPQSGRLKDVVLMATVTGFESLRHPRKSDLKQFSELFEPLFLSSSDEARRQSAAALSQCPHVPAAVALQIGSAPISIAAIFLTRSTAIDDETLVAIIRSRSPAHATAIARRENLSAHVVDTLVERRQTVAVPHPQKTSAATASAGAKTAVVAQSAEMRERLLREETLRREIKALALTTRQSASTSQPILRPIDSLHEALLVRFARTGEANLFAASLAGALDASQELGERIVLDISGQRLAAALSALALNRADQLFVLKALYPHLGERQGGTTRADILIETTDPAAVRAHVEAWLRDDRDTGEDAAHAPHLAADRPADPRQAQTRPTPPRHAETARPLRSFGRS